MAIPSHSDLVDQLLASQKTLRTWSLVITFFGDSIVPRGGEVWLGTLTTLMNGLGFDDQAVRAAVSRLTKDGWLSRRRLGRNSYYRLLEDGNREFASATDRIYGAGPAAFDGRLTLLCAKASMAKSASVSEQSSLLGKQGWGKMAPAIFCRFGNWACPDPLKSDFLRIDGTIAADEARDLVAQAWDLNDVDEAYGKLLLDFEAVSAALFGKNSATAEFAPFEALMLRTILLHCFRRVALRDPLVPVDLLPSEWAGQRAREMTARLYGALTPKADQWLDDQAVDGAGSLALVDTDTGNRFRNAFM